MEQEVWKSVKDYESLYEVSNMGRVKSLSRVVYNGYKHRRTKEKILKSGLDSDGYPHIVLCNGLTRKTVKVHLLVSYAFLNHTPDGHNMVIDHINGIKTDPRAENLRIVTNRFNMTMGIRKDRNKLSSKYAGVSWHGQNKIWVTSIMICGKHKYIGSFKNEIDASNAYQNELSNHLQNH